MKNLQQIWTKMWNVALAAKWNKISWLNLNWTESKNKLKLKRNTEKNKTNKNNKSTKQNY